MVKQATRPIGTATEQEPVAPPKPNWWKRHGKQAVPLIALVAVIGMIAALIVVFALPRGGDKDTTAAQATATTAAAQATTAPATTATPVTPVAAVPTPVTTPTGVLKFKDARAIQKYAMARDGGDLYDQPDYLAGKTIEVSGVVDYDGRIDGIKSFEQPGAAIACDPWLNPNVRQGQVITVRGTFNVFVGAAVMLRDCVVIR